MRPQRFRRKLSCPTFQFCLDANQYLALYQMPHAKTVLTALEEQQGYIFVTEQIVDEVYRVKVRVAARFLTDQLEKWELKSIAFPDHLLSTTDKSNVSMREKLRAISKQFKDTKEEFRELTCDLLKQISLSKDEISKRLAPIFARAVAHKPEELERARVRRERGNPPGKATEPLGDQLSWEQF